MEKLNIYELEIGKTYTFCNLKRKRRHIISSFFYCQNYEKEMNYYDYFIHLLKSRPKLKLDNFSFTVINKRNFVNAFVKFDGYINIYNAEHYYDEGMFYRLMGGKISKHYLLDVIVNADKYRVLQTIETLEYYFTDYQIYDVTFDVESVNNIIASIKNERPSIAALMIYDYIVQYKKLDMHRLRHGKEKIFIEI